MKKLSLVLMFFAFYGGYAQMDTTPKESAGQTLTKMCESENNEEACHSLLTQARQGCENYNQISCAYLAYVYQPEKVNFYVKNISEKERFKNWLMYMKKACVLGNQLACQNLESWKTSLEDYTKSNP